jgi:hypothetical protein
MCSSAGGCLHQLGAAGTPTGKLIVTLCLLKSTFMCPQGMLELGDIQQRLAQFVKAGLPVLVTTECLLVDKARLLPHSIFVVRDRDATYSFKHVSL